MPLYILVLHTDPVASERVAQLLEDTDHHPVVVSSGIEAHDALTFARFDALMIDVDSSVWDPLPFHDLRPGPASDRLGVPVIGMSVETEPDVDPDAASFVDLWLRKPLDPNEVQAAMNWVAHFAAAPGYPSAACAE
jgi:CheY-like chemotaxis protein